MARQSWITTVILLLVSYTLYPACLVLTSAANHRTGETCTLTFKPRSWRGKDAFEIKGSVEDSAGKPVWEIAGRMYIKPSTTWY